MNPSAIRASCIVSWGATRPRAAISRPNLKTGALYVSHETPSQRADEPAADVTVGPWMLTARPGVP